MKCPNCGKEMESGFLKSGTEPIIWVRKHLPLGLDYFKSDTLILSEQVNCSLKQALPGHICKGCKFVIGDYSEKA